MTRLGRTLVLACSVWTAASAGAWAEVKLPALFSDHMVLQQQTPIPVWGWAKAGEEITVTLSDTKAVTQASEDGRWNVTLPPVPAGGPLTMSVAGKNTLTVSDILVGEVWVCSGQSNMQFPLQKARNGSEEVASANYPEIRLFSVPRITTGQPQQDVEGAWSVCSPETVPLFSAVGYFFGRELHKARKVPVGLIHSSWGGSPAESWTSLATLEADPILKPLLECWDKNIKDYPDKLAQHCQHLKNWWAKALKDDAAGGVATSPPVPPRSPLHHHWRPGGLYNAMIMPLAPYAIQGAIWYQGESNAPRAFQYRTLFPSMIRDWRRLWGRGDFSFLFVQLANFRGRGTNSDGPSEWAELREAQTRTLDLPKTGMAVTIDIGESKDIHPKNKQDVGRRLALAARAVTYGEKDIVYSGPMYASMKREGSTIRLSFNHVGSGLTIQKGQKLLGFTIASEDQKFVPAEATIDGKTVIVHSASVAEPIAVRYAWKIDPVCNLANKEGLPASPFRTDDWPPCTKDNLTTNVR